MKNGWSTNHEGSRESNEGNEKGKTHGEDRVNIEMLDGQII